MTIIKIKFEIQAWTNFFKGARTFGRTILLAGQIGHGKNWVFKTKVDVRSRHN